jgi:hypothetical protein
MIPISISGIDDTVPINFFEKLNITNEELISDFYFLTILDQHGKCQIQIHKNFWKKIKRDKIIKNILE